MYGTGMRLVYPCQPPRTHFPVPSTYAPFRLPRAVTSNHGRNPTTPAVTSTPASWQSPRVKCPHPVPQQAPAPPAAAAPRRPPCHRSTRPARGSCCCAGSCHRRGPGPDRDGHGHAGRASENVSGRGHGAARVRAQVRGDFNAPGGNWSSSLAASPVFQSAHTRADAGGPSSSRSVSLAPPNPSITPAHGGRTHLTVPVSAVPLSAVPL